MVLTERGEREEREEDAHAHLSVPMYRRRLFALVRVSSCVCGVGVVERYCLSAHARSARSRGEGRF